MANNKTPASNQSIEARINALETAVQDMDGISQNTFSEIAAIAQLSIAYLENPAIPFCQENLAQAFSIIWNACEIGQGCINVEAERVGCNYVDGGVERRLSAMAARNQRNKAHSRGGAT
jgi:hypothetical protein